MELQVQEFARPVGSKDEDEAYRPTGPQRSSEFGLGDMVDLALKSNGYLAPSSPDFIQRAGLKPFSRFYHALQVFVDLDALTSQKPLLRQRRDLCWRNGFGYLCVPVGLNENVGAVKALYEDCLVKYNQYEKLHPRPRAVQEITVQDALGNTRKAEVPVVTIRVGGSVQGGPEEQVEALRKARPATQDEKTRLAEKTAAFQRLADTVSGKEKFFRNPFRADKSRHLPLEYTN